MIKTRILLTGIGVSLLASCASVSDSPTPAMEIAVPKHYKYQSSDGKKLERNWWTIFRDPGLNQLQNQLEEGNQSLKASLANYDASLGALGITRAQQLPRVSGTSEISRGRDTSNDRFPTGDNPYTSYRVEAEASYEVDLWGRVRQLIRQNKADAEVLGFLAADTRLALQTELAEYYFTLRFLDEEKGILQETVETREKAFKLIKNRDDSGLGNALDTSRASSLLTSAKADILVLDRERSRLENAIASLIGKPASGFSIPARETSPNFLPKIPSGIPANLLVRRPDIRAAYARLESASAKLGVTQTAPYPTLRLTGSTGLLSINESTFLNSSSRIFGIGPEVDIPIFSGGRLQFRLAQVRAEQKASLAEFQQSTLRAFAEVETALLAVKSYGQELKLRKEAQADYEKNYELAEKRFRAGSDSFLSVVDSERERLISQRSSIRAKAGLYASTIQLISALGGGYSSSK